MVASVRYIIVYASITYIIVNHIYLFRFPSPLKLQVHPNPRRDPQLKLKHYEFAGRVVGKCLYESALGGKFHLTVRARFTRSFLAQIIGLRVHYSVSAPRLLEVLYIFVFANSCTNPNMYIHIFALDNVIVLNFTFSDYYSN